MHKYLVITVMAFAALAGCASNGTVQLNDTEKQIGSITIDHFAVQGVMSAKDPVKVRDQLVAAINLAEGLLQGNVAQTTADAVVEKLKENIDLTKLKPEDAATINQLLPLISKDIVQRLGVNATTPLTAPQAAQIKGMLDDLKTALSFVRAPS